MSQEALRKGYKKEFLVKTIAVGILLLGAVSKKSPQPVTSSEANPKIKSIFFIMVLFLVQLMIKI